MQETVKSAPDVVDALAKMPLLLTEGPTPRALVASPPIFLAIVVAWWRGLKRWRDELAVPLEGRIVSAAKDEAHGISVATGQRRVLLDLLEGRGELQDGRAVLGGQQRRPEVSYTWFREQIEKGNLASVDILEKEVHGELKEPAPIMTRSTATTPTGERTDGSPNGPNAIPRASCCSTSGIRRRSSRCPRSP